MQPTEVNGILLVYWFPPGGFAPSMMEHIHAFKRNSRYPVFEWNTAHGFPETLRGYRFQVILLHYSLFGGPIYWIDEKWLAYLNKMENALKVAFFQDEYRLWGLRYDLLERLRIDIVYTCFEPQWHGETYHKHEWRGKAIYALTGYVGEDLLKMAQKHAQPRPQRRIDVGYRARRLDAYMGRGALEKNFIGEEFRRRAAAHDLPMDIDTTEEGRIYGEDWYRFIGDCRAVLGVESGASVVDTDDILWPAYYRMTYENRVIDIVAVEKVLDLAGKENNIYLRTISPRHFEAAALNTVQILFRGRYSDILEPGRHYLPLEKDFSNLDEILKALKDTSLINEIISTVRTEIIDSGRWSYQAFMRSFDNEICAAGVDMPSYGPHAMTLINKIHDDLARDTAKSRQAIVDGAQWVGPHQFERPNWPQNLKHLRNKSAREIVATGPHSEPPLNPC